MRKRLCAYCGQTRQCTRDHIPPQSFFPKPRPGPLITVPCCESCKKGQSQDDEYFRAAIISCEEVFDAPQAQQAKEALLRSLTRPSHQGFATHLSRNVIRVAMVTPAGIYLGDQSALQLNKPRIDRVSERIVRGLFFHEKEYPVPKQYQVIGRLQQDGIDDLFATLKGIAFPQVKIAGGGVFEYTFQASEEDPDTTMLLALFYRSLYFVGFTRLEPAVRSPSVTKGSGA